MHDGIYEITAANGDKIWGIYSENSNPQNLEMKGQSEESLPHPPRLMVALAASKELRENIWQPAIMTWSRTQAFSKWKDGYLINFEKWLSSQRQAGFSTAFL